MDREEKHAPASSVSKRVVIAVLASLAIVGGVAFLGSSTSEVQQSAVVNSVSDCECEDVCTSVVEDPTLLGDFAKKEQYSAANVHLCKSTQTLDCSDVSGNSPQVYVPGGESYAVCGAQGGSTAEGGSKCQQVDGESVTDMCGDHGWCLETANEEEGNYMCLCYTGYGGKQCINLIECEIEDANECNRYATCTDSDGSYSCECDRGWEGDGIECDDIDMCLTADCGNHDTCYDVVATEDPIGYDCKCSIGWDEADAHCKVDIDECSENRCNRNTKCTNTDGSFECNCNQNYEPNPGDGSPSALTCLYIDRCAPGVQECLNGATCNQGTRGCGVDQEKQNGVAAAWISSNPDTPYTQEKLNDLQYAKEACFTCDCVEGWKGTLCGTDVDECADETMNTCDVNADCVNTAGSFECVCHLGWEMTNVADPTPQYDDDDNLIIPAFEYKCTDINDCQDIAPCAHGGTCQDCGTLCFTCECVMGWRGTTCGTDWDECKMGIHICNDEATCKNNPGSYDCVCDPGWTGDGFGMNHNELDGFVSTLSDDNLEDIATARANAAAYRTGLAASPGCIDVNDCGILPSEDPCKHGTCVDHGPNNYVCTCTEGWRDANCDMDINECNPTESKTIDCSPFATCHNKDTSNQAAELSWDPSWMPLGYTCECNTGYSGNGVVCVDIDDCKKPNSKLKRRCAKHGFCTDQGTDFYTCNCDNGWIGQDCDLDENECILGNDNCGRNALCTNTQGSFTCACKDGYSGDAEKSDNGGCIDIDDCTRSDGESPCENGECSDMGLGSYLCACSDGWTDFRCDFDINECMEEGYVQCHDNAVCRNTRGSYTCDCLPGYNGDGIEQCDDVNDCAESEGGAWHTVVAVNGGCVNGDCENLPGNARICHCHEGYRGCGDPFCEKDCDECLKTPCHSSGICTIDEPTYTCECGDGWYGDGVSCSECEVCGIGMKTDTGCTTTSNTICVNVDECLDKSDQCHPTHGGCLDNMGSYTCECETDYWGDGWNNDNEKFEHMKGCTECIDCQAGFHETEPCTATSDRVCTIDLQAGQYMIESEADGTKQCLAIMPEEWFPTRQFLGNGNGFCGVAVPEDSEKSAIDIVKENKAFVWSVSNMFNNDVGENNQLYTISHGNTDPTYQGGESRCLYFGNGGQDVYPSLQSCIDYEGNCPWGSGTTSPSLTNYCDFQTDSEDIRTALIENGQAVFQIKSVKMVEKKYIIQSKSRTDKSTWECLAFEDQGAATNPSRYSWGNGDEWCGVGDWDGYGKEMALLNNKQAVFIFTEL